ncbi:MAG: hypothetical protein ABFC84_14035 [Veillonellales bacterium]
MDVELLLRKLEQTSPRQPDNAYLMRLLQLPAFCRDFHNVGRANAKIIGDAFKEVTAGTPLSINLV